MYKMCSSNFRCVCLWRSKDRVFLSFLLVFVVYKPMWLLLPNCMGVRCIHDLEDETMVVYWLGYCVLE